MKKISRREFFLLAAIATGSTLAACAKNLIIPDTGSISAIATKALYLPSVSNGSGILATATKIETFTPTLTKTTQPGVGPKVIQVHCANATSWDYSSSWYGNYVDQNVVNTMYDEGIKQLTGQSIVATAWQSILPNYSSGKAIAVKVNFNNSYNCNGGGLQIDAIIEPVNALVRGLKTIGVQESDIWVYDAIRCLPTRFISRCLYPRVRFWGYPDCGATQSSLTSSDPHALVAFNAPNGITMPTIRIADVLINATYLINLPIMKNHGNPGVSLTFKNHFGTIDHPSLLHDYILLDSAKYNPNYNPLVDIYKNPHISNKAILTIGDGLYGSKDYSSAPGRWTTFGNDSPNSLFFSRDPVAIDSVMHDLIASELSVWNGANDYLKLAEIAGLGTFEHGNPWGIGYSKINYIKINLP